MKMYIMYYVIIENRTRTWYSVRQAIFQHSFSHGLLEGSSLIFGKIYEYSTLPSGFWKKE